MYQTMDIYYVPIMLSVGNLMVKIPDSQTAFETVRVRLPLPHCGNMV